MASGLIVPAMQRGTIVVAALVAVLVSRLVGGGSPAQAGFVAGLVIYQLAAVLKASQSCFDVGELRSRHDILLSSWKNARNLFLRLADPIRSLGMGGECLRQRTRLLFLAGLQLLKKLHERVRIVAGLVHVLQTEVIRFRLKPSREAQEGQWQRQSSRRTDGISNSTTHKD